MPFTGTESALSATIKSEILARPAAGAVDGAALDALCEAIATAVISHLLSAGTARINPLGLIAPTGGGPVTGTGSLL